MFFYSPLEIFLVDIILDFACCIHVHFHSRIFLPFCIYQLSICIIRLAFAMKIFLNVFRPVYKVFLPIGLFSYLAVATAWFDAAVKRWRRYFKHDSFSWKCFHSLVKLFIHRFAVFESRFSFQIIRCCQFFSDLIIYWTKCFLDAL